MTQDVSTSDRPPASKLKQHQPPMPAFPVLVESAGAQAALSAAVGRALEALDEYLTVVSLGSAVLGEAGRPVLTDALTGLLLGRAPGVAPMLGSRAGFGVLRTPRTSERVTMATVLPESARLMFFDGSSGFVPLARLKADSLYPSSDEAVDAVFEWLAQQGHSPRDYSLRLSLVNFNRSGTPELGEVL